MSLSHTFCSARRLRRWVSWVALALSVVAGPAFAQALVDISNTPLYGGRQAHPNVVVSTSVEFPTVAVAYNGIGYNRTSVYLGYFDPTQCYKYTGDLLLVGAVTGTFVVDSAADVNHECAGGADFSGNMMNWASMSAIDEFRYAMTGGNRIAETAGSGEAGGAVIERAYLPDGLVAGVPSFYASSSYFPVLTLNGSFSSPLANVLPSAIAAAGTVYIANCGTRLFISTFSPGSGNSCLVNPAADKGAYHVAVGVCGSAEGPVRTDLCLLYGTTYKPVGQIQINAANMRFAAFGYLMDRTYGTYVVSQGCGRDSTGYTGWNRCRYGGVLRAPMTYVGPYAYDANQVQSSNESHREINVDGSLVADPERTQASASAVGGLYSGVINYINKFGSGTNILTALLPNALGGVYKRYDPGTEMFYEAVRYYQNLGPTALATQGLPTLFTDYNAVLDYFPITTTWTDPILSICSANYIINLSDANMWDDTYVPGFNNVPGAGAGRPTSRPVDASGLDSVAWTQKIGVLESTTPSIANYDIRANLAGLETRYFNYQQQGSYLAPGIAYWANVNDIRADLAGKQTIKTISFDVGEQTSGYAVQDRQLYLMGKYGGFNNTIDRSIDTYPNPFYALNPANPASAAIRSNTEWADSNVLPVDYVLASNPTKLITGIRAAFQSIGTQTGNLSGAALTSANLTFGAAGAYVATFNAAKWSGSVLFESLSVDSSGNLQVSTSPIWDSGALLTARCGTVASLSTVCRDDSTVVAKRNIVTTISLSGIRTAAPFSLSGISSDTTYVGYLNTNPSTAAPDGQAGARVNYLRGYRADEGSDLAFRTRDSVMGDVINSGPVYEGVPTANIPDADYQAFYTANAITTPRPPTVYVGANDGMLHAFDASTGSETFAYIPGFSAPDLAALTDPGYSHKTYVDTVPKIQEVKLNGTWKSVLVGANGNGVQGIFGLDVTQPTSFSAASVLFEFSDADDADFGSVTAAPEIAKLWVSGTAAAPVYRYFAVVTGYNKARTTVNGRPDTKVSTDTQNRGTLFLIALDHALGTTWTLNADYYKFNFPASNPALANGLAPVTLLASKSGDQTTAYMYFGDLQGNLWKLNTGTGSPTTWAPVLGTVSTPLPIFVAQDNNGNRQPITARVELAGGPFGSTLVYFGTGKYFGATDLTLPASIQSEYSLLDVNPSVLINRSSDLVARVGTVSGTTVTITGAAFSYSGTSAKKGWYFDFPSSTNLGERSVTKPAVSTGLLTFTTLTLSNDVCLPGNGYVYQIDALSGLPFTSSTNGITGGYASTVGIPGPPRVVDLSLAAGQNQVTGEVINKKTLTTLVSGTAGTISNPGGKVQTKAPPTQQINWREITNYNDRTGN